MVINISKKDYEEYLFGKLEINLNKAMERVIDTFGKGKKEDRIIIRFINMDNSIIGKDHLFFSGDIRWLNHLIINILKRKESKRVGIQYCHNYGDQRLISTFKDAKIVKEVLKLIVEKIIYFDKNYKNESTESEYNSLRELTNLTLFT